MSECLTRMLWYYLRQEFRICNTILYKAMSIIMVVFSEYHTRFTIIHHDVMKQTFTIIILIILCE